MNQKENKTKEEEELINLKSQAIKEVKEKNEKELEKISKQLDIEAEEVKKEKLRKLKKITEKQQPILENEKEENESQAKRRNILLKRYKTWHGSKFELAKFETPFMLLMRRGNKTEWFENATAGEFHFEHSDGQERTIFLDPSKLRSLEYGSDTAYGYVCHEDFPFPLPEDPVVTTEMMGVAVEKTLNDIKKWKTQEIRAKTDFYKTIGLIMIGLVIAYIVYKMVVPTPPEPAQIAQTAGQIARDVTKLG